MKSEESIIKYPIRHYTKKKKLLKFIPSVQGLPEHLADLVPCQCSLHVNDLVRFVPNQQVTHRAVSKCTVTSRPLGGALHHLFSHNITIQVALTQSRPNIESDQWFKEPTCFTAPQRKKMKYLYKYGLYITIIDLSPAIGRQRFDSFLLHQPFLITITSNQHCPQSLELLLVKLPCGSNLFSGF